MFRKPAFWIVLLAVLATALIFTDAWQASATERTQKDDTIVIAPVLIVGYTTEQDAYLHPGGDCHAYHAQGDTPEGDTGDCDYSNVGAVLADTKDHDNTPTLSVSDPYVPVDECNGIPLDLCDNPNPPMDPPKVNPPDDNPCDGSDCCIPGFPGCDGGGDDDGGDDNGGDDDGNNGGGGEETHTDNGNHYGNDKPDNNQHDVNNSHNGEQTYDDHHDDGHGNDGQPKVKDNNGKKP